MCGIAAIFSTHAGLIDDIEGTLFSMMQKIAHRGDSSLFNECLIKPNFGLSTNRLAIVERASAKQPASDVALDVHAVLNGQIFNYKQVREELVKLGSTFEGGGDAEVLLKAYLHYGPSFVEHLDGMFAFVIIDNNNGKLLIGRDHVGIKPLYYALKEHVWYAASEMKSLLDLGVEIRTLGPGEVFDGEHVYKYVTYSKNAVKSLDDHDVAKLKVRELMEHAVKSQVDTDLPIAVMFSGGLDSAVVLYLANKYHPDVTAISFGLPGSSDIAIAQKFCAEHNIRHIISTFTEDDLIKNIPDAVYFSESFEKIDAIDSAIAHFGYHIANKLGFKVALCGEGSDEIFYGYDLFKSHASPEELSLYRLNNLHRTDLQRVDRASMRNTVEARVPFMNHELVAYALSLDDDLKLRDGVEKHILREAFRDVLPDYVVDRPKIRMPDGSGVKNTIVDYVDGLELQVSSDVIHALGGIGIKDKSSLYFAESYLGFGYPFPLTRFKEVGKDFSESGYFHFIS